MTLRHLLLAATSFSACAAAAHAQPIATAPAPEVAEVVVQATPLRHEVTEVATPVAVLQGQDLVHRRRATLGETLQSLPGVSADTFGGGASRPVIRGQTAPRVKVLSDSSELMDASAVSPDHAITTEPLLLESVEVLRGPSALLYGGGAIAGAVNLVDKKIPTRIPANGVEGEAELRGGTNAEERAGVFGLTVGGESLALRFEAAGRTSEDYEAPGRGRVAGTFNDSSTITVGGAWIGARGYLGAAFTRQDSDYGLPGHSHEYESCHPHGTHLHCGGHGHDEDDHGHGHEDEDDHGAGPFVRMVSERWDIRGEYRDPLPGLERLRLRAGVTDYRHDEIDEGEPATTFLNSGYDVRLEAEHRPVFGWRGAIGLQTAFSDFSALGEDAFLPPTETRTTGLFLLEELELGDWHFELAARKDWQEIEGAEVERTEHDPFSISASVRWTFLPGYSVAVAAARSQRAPTTQELHAHGLHLATNTYELGDAGLKVETADTIDLTLRKTTGATTFTAGVFHYRIDDYIFAETLDQFEDFRLIRYAQMDARFTGFDAELTHRFTPNLSATVFGDYVRAKLADGGGDLPRIPAGRLGLRGNGRSGAVSGELEYVRVFEQDRIAAFESETAGYDLVNATVAYDWTAGPAKVQLYVRGENLLDELAFNHASFLSRITPLPGRTVTLGLRTAF